MKTFLQRLRNFARREDGPTAVEYAVILALIIVVCLGAISTLSQSNTANAIPVTDFTIGDHSVTIETEEGKTTYVHTREAKDGEVTVKHVGVTPTNIYVEVTDNEGVRKVYVRKKKKE